MTPEARAFVESARLGHLATVSPDGTPHVVPICYGFDGVCFYSVIDQKPKRVSPNNLRRIQNILGNPNVSLVIDRYDEDWTRLGFVLVTGTAVILWEGHEHREALHLLRGKYPQYRVMPLEGRPVIKVSPQRVICWGDLSG